MTTYAIQRRSDGEIVHAYTADAAEEWQEYPFAQFNHIPQPEAPQVQARTISKLAFRGRFTQAEKVTIELAALDDPAAPMQQRQMAAALRSYLADVAVAEFIDLDRPDTAAGVQALEQMGLIGVGRAAEILA